MADGQTALVEPLLNSICPMQQVGYVEPRQLCNVFAVDKEMERLAVEAVAVTFGAFHA